MKESRKALFFTVEKVAIPLFREGCGLLQRTRCLLKADNSHICRPRCVFAHAHVAVENDSIFFAATAAKLCEAFVYAYL